MIKIDEADLVRRATAAHFRGGRTEQPANTSDVREHDEKTYVVLRNVDGVLGVYRLRSVGTLKAMKRWPKEIEL